MIRIPHKYHLDQIINVYGIAVTKRGRYHILRKKHEDPEYHTGGIPKILKAGWELKYLDESVPKEPYHLQGYIWNSYSDENPMKFQIEVSNQSSLRSMQEEILY